MDTRKTASSDLGKHVEVGISGSLKEWKEQGSGTQACDAQWSQAISLPCLASRRQLDWTHSTVPNVIHLSLIHAHYMFCVPQCYKRYTVVPQSKSYVYDKIQVLQGLLRLSHIELNKSFLFHRNDFHTGHSNLCIQSSIVPSTQQNLQHGIGTGENEQNNPGI